MMGKYEDCKMTLASLREDEYDCGLELTLGLSLRGSKSNGTAKGSLKQKNFKQSEEPNSISKLGPAKEAAAYTSMGETACASLQLSWMNKSLVREHDQGEHMRLCVSSSFDKSSCEEVADRGVPKFLSHEFLNLLQEKADQTEVSQGLESLNQVSGQAAASAATAAWEAKFAQIPPPPPVYDKDRECREHASAASWLPGSSTASSCIGYDASINNLTNSVKATVQLLPYPSLGQDIVLNEKHEVSRTASFDRNQWQTMTQQQEILEQQRKKELHARQEARKKRRILIDEQKQQKKLARCEDDKANNNSAKFSSQIPPSSASKSCGKDVLNSQGGIGIGESGTGFPCSTITSSKVSTNLVVHAKKLERKQASSSIDILNEENEQMREMRRVLVREREKAAKERGMEAESRLTSGQNDSRSGGETGELHRMKGEQAPPVESGVGSSIGGGIEDTKADMEGRFHQLIDPQTTDPQAYYSLAVAASKNRSGDSWNQTQITNGITPRMKDRIDSIPAEGHLSSGCTTVSIIAAGCKEQKGSSSSSGEARGFEKIKTGGAQEETQSISPSASIDMGMFPLPLPYSSFLHMQMPFPNHPVPNCGIPYPMALPYPYFLQCVSSSQNSSASCSLGTSPIPVATTPAFPRFQLPALEAQASCLSTSYFPSHPTHSLSAIPAQNISATSAQNKSSTSSAEHDFRTSQGSLKQEVCRPASRRGEPLKGGITALLRAASLSSTQGQVGTLARSQLPFAIPPSGSAAAPTTIGLGLMRTLSEPGEKFLCRQGSEASPFASLVAAVKASQGLSAAVASVSKCSSQTTKRGFDCCSPRCSDAQDKSSSSKTTLSRGFCELSRSDSIQKSPAFDEAVETKKSEQSSKGGAAQDLETADDDVVAREGASSFSPGITTSGQTLGGIGSSSPDLPWVSTTGTGPNGKTITGVLYRYVKGEVKILCACHGKHMTPREFVQHAGGVDVPNPEKSIVVNPFPFVGQAASVIA